MNSQGTAINRQLTAEDKPAELPGNRSQSIERIETVPIQVPLDRVYRGSHCSMRNRCTIITRVYTADGAVGECYNGDADEEQVQIVGIIHGEIEPLLRGTDAWNVELC